MSNTVEAIDSRKTQTGEQINDLEGRMVEITAVQQNTEKWKKKKKRTVSKRPWDIKHTNICIIGVPEDGNAPIAFSLCSLFFLLFFLKLSSSTVEKLFIHILYIQIVCKI